MPTEPTTERPNSDYDFIPWEEVKAQLEPKEEAMFMAAFLGARDAHEIVQLTIYGRRYMVSPSGKVWLIVDKR